MTEKLSKIKEQLTTCVESELAKGVECVDTEEMGAVVDMIKDLAEAEYYCSVVEAMDDYEDDYENPRMGYSRGRSQSGSRGSRSGGSRSGGRSGSRSQSGSMRMGYTDTDDYWMDPRYEDMNEPMDKIREMEDPRYGKAYNKFRMARKHYHDTKSMSDREEMSESAKEHMTDTVMTIKEMWKDADPDLRKDIRMNLEALMKEINM